jgi:L-fuconolactonase
MRIDAHQHFWIYSPEQYPWIPKGSPLHQNWLPEDLAPLQAPLRFDGSIAVQARQSLEETRWLLELAERTPRIHGVVGWVDLRSPDLAVTLYDLAKHPKLVGFRHVAQDEPDDGFLARESFVQGVAQLAAFGFTYDLLIYPKQLPAAIELVRQLPSQRFVLDHLAKPQIRERLFQPWKDQLTELARHPNVHCKLSGLVTEADPKNWCAADFVPYLETALEVFGPDRLMFGSDWPVCLLAGSYSDVYQLVADFLEPRLSADQLAAVLGGNCGRFYQRSA